jgi:hypothetical protein
MRRTYISPEFNYKAVPGSFNMLESSSFFGSKMLEIEDSISIKNENIIYYQSATGEQIDLAVERTLPQLVYDTVEDKRIYSTLNIDDSKLKGFRDENVPWILDIQVNTILSNYLFAVMKKFRTFEGLPNNLTYDNSVNAALRQYIQKNVINRYRFSKIEFYLKSISLLTTGRLKYDNRWNVNIETGANLFSKFQTETEFGTEDLRVLFFQPESANSFCFDYYYNLYFEKI